MIQHDHLSECMYNVVGRAQKHRTPNMKRQRYQVMVKIKTRRAMHVTILEKLDTTKKEIVDCDRLLPRA